MILFGLSGHGHFDMSPTTPIWRELGDLELPQATIGATIGELPKVPAG